MISRANMLDELGRELDLVLADAPEHLSDDSRQRIRGEFLDYAQRLIDSLSSRELQSGFAFDRFLESTLAQARLQMHFR